MEDKELGNLVSSIENDVFKEYLRSFDEYTPVKQSKLDIEGWKEKRIRNIKISKFIRTPKEEDIDNLCQLFQAFNNEECTIGILFNHTLKETEVYFRIADIRDDVSSPGKINSLSDRTKRILSSTYSGVDIEELSPEKDVLKRSKHIVSVTNLASEKNENFVSIENLLTYNDKAGYSVLLLAEPICDQSVFKEEITKLCAFLSEIGQYESEQLTKNTSSSKNRNAGFALFLSAGMGSTETVGDTVAKTISNYSVKHMNEQINKNLDRVELCKALGGWKFATYVISDSLEMAKNIAYQYDSIVKGKDSNSVSSAIISWDSTESNVMFDYLLTNRHPRFSSKQDESVKKSLAIMISSLELAHAMNFPRKSVPGFPVAECASFGRNISFLDGELDNQKLKIGSLWHMRHDDGKIVEIDENLLTSHMFITGSTGSGKSNCVYQIINGLATTNKKFLVIEPTKGEYKTIFGGREDVYVYGTNPSKTDILRINPFSFPDGMQLYAHIDRLIEIFNACWPMYAAMPAILKDAIEGAYINTGWNLKTSENKTGVRIFPTFVDVLRQIDVIMDESDYSGESKGDYKGALKTRLKSMTNGIYSLIFAYDEIADCELFNANVIVDLSEIGSETTSLIMGILVLKLHEFRMISREKSEGTDSNLSHITVLEEAHNLLRRTSIDQSAESSNLVGKSVEMISNAIAEMRTYGEGFIIVDQAPSALDASAIRNTNTKIVLRLPDYSDRELVGKSIGLSDEQIDELFRLERGVAAVYQSGWAESVLCKFGLFKEIKPLVPRRIDISLYDNEDSIDANLLDCIMNQEIYRKGERAEIGKLKAEVLFSKIDAIVKCDLINYISADKSKAIEPLRRLIFDLLNADKAIARAKKCDNLSDWVHTVVDNLNPSINSYSNQQIDLVLALMLQELIARDTRYSNLYCCFTQEYKERGGVFQCQKYQLMSTPEI